MPVTLGSSIPSLPISAIDKPEITSFTSTFVYNFYSTDELTNSSGGWYDNVKKIVVRANPNTDPSSINYSRNVPRYNYLVWNKVNIGSANVTKEDFVGISLRDNAAQIIDEDTLSLRYFTNFEQQETSFVAQRQVYLDKLYRLIGYNRTNASLTDAIRALHETTPEGVTQEFLTRYLNVAHSENTSTDKYDPNPAARLENIKTVAPINNRVYGTLLHEKLVNDSLIDINNPQIASGLADSFATQNSVQLYANRFNGSQYDFSLQQPISTKVSDYESDFGTVYQSTGYVITRYRQLNTGELVEKTQFYIENPDTVDYIDTNILYNQRYIYDIKSVTAVKTLTFNSEHRLNAVSTFLVASSPTRTQVKTTDTAPPEPPTDFFVRWDYGLKKPVLTWNFPIDTRRHIKYFQVFRRKNVGNVRPAQLPFELVRMYDFNDLQSGEGTFFQRPPPQQSGYFSFLNGEASISANAVVNQSTIKEQDVFVPTCYVDEDFNNEDYYIYAVACVDAHGVTSNYSNQIGVKFNKQRNTIERVDISAPGAPKPYPNLYLNKDTFVDTIKNEGYSQMTVVFNPEYLEVARQGGENIKLMNFGPDNKYRIQLINTDIQEDQFVDVTITDDRNLG